MSHNGVMATTMSVSEILSLYSVDCAGETAAEVIADKQAGAWWYDGLRTVMASSPAQMPPILVAPASDMLRYYGDRSTAGWIAECAESGDPLMVGNGHHRLKIAVEMGWAEIAVTTDLSASE